MSWVALAEIESFLGHKKNLKVKTPDYIMNYIGITLILNNWALDLLYTKKLSQEKNLRRICLWGTFRKGAFMTNTSVIDAT